MSANSEIEQGSDVCPSCKSDRWKSARMVVMEGTTNTTGTIDGTITDPGAFSGGISNFLLSDRWFSWDYPIEAEIGLTSSTGLVEEVKRLMVHFSSKVQMPSPPVEPKGISFFERVKLTPAKPRPPTRPQTLKNMKKPEMLKEDEKKAKRTSKFANYMALIFLLGLWFLGVRFNLVKNNITFDDTGAITVWVVSSVLVVMFLRKLFFGKTKKEKNEDAFKEYEDVLKRHSEKLAQYERDCEIYENNLQLYRLQREELHSREREVEHAEALYERQLSEYETEKNNIMKVRELLWWRARVCMRCGTAYLGSD